jgi:hypothetical protein
MSLLIIDTERLLGTPSFLIIHMYTRPERWVAAVIVAILCLAIILLSLGWGPISSEARSLLIPVLAGFIPLSLAWGFKGWLSPEIPELGTPKQPTEILGTPNNLHIFKKVFERSPSERDIQRLIDFWRSVTPNQETSFHVSRPKIENPFMLGGAEGIVRTLVIPINIRMTASF